MACGNNLKTYLVGGFSAIGGFLFGYHTGVISGVLTMSDFKNTMGINESSTTSKYDDVISNAKIGGIVSVLLFGCFLGSLIGGQASDRFSRKYSICIFSIIFSIGAALQMATSWLSMLLVGRFIAGISIGALSMIVPIYHSEIAATRVRGRIITLQQLAIMIGIATSFWVNYVTHRTLVNRGGEWRVSLGLQIIPSLILAIGILFCPFSPRWLISRDREDEARDILVRIRSVSLDEIEEEVARIRREVAHLREHEIGSYRQLFHSPLLRPFILGIGIQVLQQLTGINSTIYYAPEIFSQTLRNTTTNNTLSFALLATGVNGCVTVVATIPTFIFIDKLGRRILLMSGALIMSISMLIVAILIMSCGDLQSDSRTHYSTYTINDPKIAWLIIVFIYIFVGGFAFSWGPIAWVYCAEIFPLTIRAKATSLTTAANWATNCAISFLVPILFKYIPAGIFIIFFVFCATMIGLVYFFYPETKDRHLEENIPLTDCNQIPVPPLSRQQRTNNNTFLRQQIDNQRNVVFTNEQYLMNRPNRTNRSDAIEQSNDSLHGRSARSN